jgi:hypothetical protein
MADLAKNYHPYDENAARLDNYLPSNGPIQDPLELPSVRPPLDGAIEETPPAQEPPPNGGLDAWLQVLGSFFLLFNSWSVGLNVALYQKFENALLRPPQFQ